MEEPNPPAAPPPPPPPAADPPRPPPASPQERIANLEKIKKAKRRKGFLIGIVAGQALVLLMVFGGEILLKLFASRIRLQVQIPGVDHPIRFLVFLGMTAGLLATALLIFFILGIQGAGYVLGKKKVGFLTAVGRGMKRAFKAAWAIGLTLGFIGGTAWLLIPFEERDHAKVYMNKKWTEAQQKVRRAAEDLLKPAPKDPPSENP